MTRYVIRRELVETIESRQRRARSGVDWLASCGGGTVLVPGWNEFEECFGRNRESYISLMLRSGVRFDKVSGRTYGEGNVLSVYPLLDELQAIEHGWIGGDIMTVEWDKDVTGWWAGRHEVHEWNPPDLQGA